ncbi:MAG: hypothetical protein JNL87_20295 [Burkholderiaceae bacterium]|nr:hypothetical protein [Burkholderiaceae bacterium]
MQSSAEVAKWGEQWLQDWIAEPGIPDHERETRGWLAEGWREWSLESWVYWATHDRHMTGGHSWDEFEANHESNNHFRLYRRERSGLLVWRMFSEYRERGLPVPEAILSTFDVWARRLEVASGIKDIAAAIEMTGPGGGPQGAAHLRKVERQREIVSEVEQLKGLGAGMTSAEAQRRVAKRKGLTVAAVRAACTRWSAGKRARDKSRLNSEPDSVRLLRTLGR